MGALDGRIALVTGGSRGIGRTVARALADDGADVAISYRRDGDLGRECVAAVEAMGRRGWCFAADLELAHDVDRLADQVLEATGGVDILVNNAGMGFRGAPVLETERWEVEQAFALNAIAAHQLCRRLLPAMRNRERGDVVMLSSVATAIQGADHAPYVMSKVALEALAVVLAKEERAHGIHVNIVAPGLTATEMGAGFLRKLGVDEFSAVDHMMPFGRVCRPEDVANIVRFLVSAGAGYVTGQKIYVDGGGGFEQRAATEFEEKT